MLTLMFFFAAMVIMRSIPSARASSGLKGMTSSLTAPASSLLKSRRLSMISSKSSQLPRAVVTKSRCSLFFFECDRVSLWRRNGGTRERRHALVELGFAEETEETVEGAERSS